PRDEAFGLLVPREDDAAFSRDALERNVRPDVGERLHDRGASVDDANLVGKEENAVASAHDERSAVLAFEPEHLRRRGARSIDGRLRRSSDGLVARLREADDVRSTRERQIDRLTVERVLA